MPQLTPVVHIATVVVPRRGISPNWRLLPGSGLGPSTDSCVGPCPSLSASASASVGAACPTQVPSVSAAARSSSRHPSRASTPCAPPCAPPRTPGSAHINCITQLARIWDWLLRNTGHGRHSARCWTAGWRAGWRLGCRTRWKDSHVVQEVKA